MPEMLKADKLGVLTASVCAAVFGNSIRIWLTLRAEGLRTGQPIARIATDKPA